MKNGAGERTRQEWQEVVAGRATSGMNTGEYCRSIGISQNQFYSWQRRLRGPAKKGPTFIELSPGESASSGGATIELEILGVGVLRIRG